MAAWTLGMRFEERGAAKLAEAYANPRETAYVRSYAAEALGHLAPHNEKAREFTPLLVGGLTSGSPEIRFWSCFALASFADESAVPALQELLGDESEVRGWGQRDFPRFVDTAAPEPVPMPVEARLLGELDAVLREHGAG